MRHADGMPETPVVNCVLLWARPGMEAAHSAYEDKVPRLVAEHGGRVLERGTVLSGFRHGIAGANVPGSGGAGRRPPPLTCGRDWAWPGGAARCGDTGVRTLVAPGAGRPPPRPADRVSGSA